MECTKVHALDIPEILYSVGLFLSHDSLVKCFRVSKLWHRVLLPWLWETTKITGQYKFVNPSPSSILKNASFIRQLSINYQALLALSGSTTTFPILSNLVVYQSIWGKPFDDPTLVEFIKRHRGTLRAVYLAQHANKAVLSALEECQRLESLTLENQDHVLHSTEWIRQFEQLWSHLSSISLHDNINPGPSTAIASTTVDWPRSSTPNRIRNLELTFNQPESVLGFGAWIVKQCPELVQLHWYYVASDADSPMEQLADIFREDATFGKKLEDIAMTQMKFRNTTFQFLMASLVQLHRLNLWSTNFDQKSWMILRTTKPAHLKTLVSLNLDHCLKLPAKDIHQMLCEMPSLKVFIATVVEDKEMVEDSQPWAYRDLEELTLRLSLTGFSADPSVRTLAIEKYLARVGQLRRLEVLKDFLPRDEEGTIILLEVEGGLDVLKDLRRLRNAVWTRRFFSGEHKVRWILENWPQLENVLRSRLRVALENSVSSQSATNRTAS